MSEYLTTESEISELSLYDDEYNELLTKNNRLSNELEMVTKTLRDKEFELGNTINIIQFENEKLKQTVKSYESLIEYYKISEDKDKEINDTKSNSLLIKENLNLFKKIAELETKVFNSEQTEHNYKREIFTLNSSITQLKFEIEKLNNNKEEKSLSISIDDNCSLKNNHNLIQNLQPTKFTTTTPSKNRKSSETHSQIDENDIKELLQEIDDLKKEKAEISERALSMLTEKELLYLELRTQLEEIKAKYEGEIFELKNRDREQTFDNNYDNSDCRICTKNKEQDEEYENLRALTRGKEIEWDKERDGFNKAINSLENYNREVINEYENEINQLKNDMFNIELERGSLEKELIKDKSSIESEIEHYSTTIKFLEDQKLKSEQNAKKEINSLKTEIKELVLHNSTLLEQVNTLQIALNDSKNEITKKIELIQEKCKYDISLKENEILKHKNIIESLEKDNESLRKDCENNRKNNDRIKDEYKDLLDQLRKLKDNHEEEKRKWDDKLFSLEKSFERDRILFKKQLRESVEDKKSDESSASDKKPTTYTITSSTLLDYNSEENNSLLRNKVSILESEVQKLKSVVKLKENKNANIFRLNGEIDILKKEKSKMKNELEEIKNMYEIQIKDLLQKVNIRNNESEFTPRRASLKPGNYNSKHLLENLELEEKIERQTVENKFLSEQIEILKKDIQNSKIIKDHEIKKILLDLEDANTVAATAKISLAQLQFEKDTEIIKYKNICKKLKIKLGNLKMSKNIQNSNQNNNLTSSAAPKKSYSFFRDIFK